MSEATLRPLARLRESEGPAASRPAAPGAAAAPASAGGQGEKRWGIVVDVNRCVGCQTCTAACKHANETPPGVQWRRVLDVETGRFPDVERLFLVTGCQHCAEPPCVPVCPTGATRQRADGFVTQDYETCIGCGYCAVACPYDARTIVHEKRAAFGAGRATRQEEAAAHEERLGVAQKCTFCIGRVDAGLAQGLVPGVDPAATPACVSSCIADALHFGDFEDPGSNVAALLAEGRSFALLEELGTRPSIRYLYETPAVPGRAARPDEQDEERMADPSNPLVGKLQRFWDYRAAMNFTLGGLGSGLALSAFATWLAAGLPTPLLLGLFLAAGALMAVGLAFVFFEIGRKLRFLHALKRPQSSWMTREVYVVAAFYPLLAADLLFPRPALHTAVALAAAAFLYCQARILHAGKGIPAWRAPLMPSMLIASGLAEGAGLAIAVVALANVGKAPLAALAVLGLGLALLNAELWRRYRRGAATNGLGVLARRVLDGLTPWLHGLGHAVPIACFAASLTPRTPDALALAAFGGLAAAAGGALWKFAVITRAAYRQDLAIPKLPQRGSGARAAPSRLAAEQEAIA
jgi:phenylacetyl-CoA:acceptor oxidoreductase subunit 1